MAREAESTRTEESKFKYFFTDTGEEFGVKLYTEKFTVDTAELFLKNLRNDCIERPKMVIRLEIVFPGCITSNVLNQADLKETIEMGEKDTRSFFRTYANQIVHAESVVLLQGAKSEKPNHSNIFSEFIKKNFGKKA